jgi:hypothetical protein
MLIITDKDACINVANSVIDINPFDKSTTNILERFILMDESNTTKFELSHRFLLNNKLLGLENFGSALTVT